MAVSPPTRTVLAAVADTGAHAQMAARKALELAWLLGADVVLYHACYEPSLSGRPFFDTPGLAAARREHVGRATQSLEKLAATFADAGREVRVRVEWQRSIPEAVARAATREGADLVVAEPRYRATRRTRGLSRIDWEIALRCPVPLLLARSAAPYAKPRIVAAIDPAAHGVRISSLDTSIVNLAALVAKATSGSVRVLHCLREPALPVPTRWASVRRERERVQSLVRHVALGAGLRSRDARILDGPPVERLLDAVVADQADLLVMGTVVRGPLARRLIGSTAEQLMHSAPCDLLLVKPGGSVRWGAARRAAEARPVARGRPGRVRPRTSD
jgi:universal stress protein E